MRAKTINELNRFERGKNPKSAMDIGGFIPDDYFNETVQKAIDSWEQYMKEKLEGKWVLGKLRTMGGDGNWKTIDDAEIKVYKVWFDRNLEKTFKIILEVRGSENGYNYSRRYQIPDGGKIYIKE